LFFGAVEILFNIFTSYVLERYGADSFNEDLFLNGQVAVVGNLHLAILVVVGLLLYHEVNFYIL